MTSENSATRLILCNGRLQGLGHLRHHLQGPDIWMTYGYIMIYVCVIWCIYIYMCVHMYVHMYVYMYVCVVMYIYILIWVYIYM